MQHIVDVFHLGTRVLEFYCCTEKLKNARTKLLTSRNKHSIFIPNSDIFILERNLIRADFDHVLGNHF